MIANEKVFIGHGIEIAYTESGSGKDVMIFIHGLANYQGVWYQNILELGAHYRCIAIDLPGNGLSSKAEDRPYSLFFYAECIQLFLQELKIENAVIAGHSMGGHIAMIFALRYPLMCSKLILLAPSGLEQFSVIEKNWMKQMMDMGSMVISDEMSLVHAIENSFYSNVQKQSSPIISDLKSYFPLHRGLHWSKMVRANINAMLDEQITQFIPMLQLPVLLIFGKEDAMIPNKMVHPFETTENLLKKSAKVFPNVEAHLITAAGHFVQIEAAHEVNKLIVKFMNKHT